LFLTVERLFSSFLLRAQRAGSLFHQKEKIDEPILGFFEIFTERINMFLRKLRICFKLNVGLTGFIIEKPPAGGFEELVDFNARLASFDICSISIRLTFVLDIHVEPFIAVRSGGT